MDNVGFWFNENDFRISVKERSLRGTQKKEMICLSLCVWFFVFMSYFDFDYLVYACDRNRILTLSFRLLDSFIVCFIDCSSSKDTPNTNDEQTLLAVIAWRLTNTQIDAQVHKKVFIKQEVRERAHYLADKSNSSLMSSMALSDFQMINLAKYFSYSRRENIRPYSTKKATPSFRWMHQFQSIRMLNLHPMFSIFLEIRPNYVKRFDTKLMLSCVWFQKTLPICPSTLRFFWPINVFQYSKLHIQSDAWLCVKLESSSSLWHLWFGES